MVEFLSSRLSLLYPHRLPVEKPPLSPVHKFPLSVVDWVSFTSAGKAQFISGVEKLAQIQVSLASLPRYDRAPFSRLSIQISSRRLVCPLQLLKWLYDGSIILHGSLLNPWTPRKEKDLGSICTDNRPLHWRLRTQFSIKTLMVNSDLKSLLVTFVPAF